jgi:hypothetical protein
MIRVYPFASGSEYTSSFALTSQFATSASGFNYLLTSSVAGVGRGPSGSAAAINICLITYDEYNKLIYTSSLQEQCFFPTT